MIDKLKIMFMMILLHKEHECPTCGYIWFISIFNKNIELTCPWCGAING